MQTVEEMKISLNGNQSILQHFLLDVFTVEYVTGYKTAARAAANY